MLRYFDEKKIDLTSIFRRIQCSELAREYSISIGKSDLAAARRAFNNGLPETVTGVLSPKSKVAKIYGLGMSKLLKITIFRIL